MKLLTGYESDKERKAHSDASGFACRGDSLTVQADAKDADINVIMDRYARTGQLVPPSRLPSYGDFEGISDYRTALHAVREAEESFMALPANIRAKFDNDPGKFEDFCVNPDNRAAVAELGLLSEEATREVKAQAAAAKAAQEAPQDATRRPIDPPRGHASERSAPPAGGAKDH